jgi:acylphosphatase
MSENTPNLKELAAQICRDYKLETAVLVTVAANDETTARVEVVANGPNKKAAITMKNIVAEGISRSIDKFRKEQAEKAKQEATNAG